MLYIYINVVCITCNIKALCEGTRKFSRSLKLYILDDVESGLVVRFSLYEQQFVRECSKVTSLWPSHCVRFSFFRFFFFLFFVWAVFLGWCFVKSSRLQFVRSGMASRRAYSVLFFSVLFFFFFQTGK